MREKHGLGEFEMLVVAALMRLGEDAYGASVRQEIESTAQRPTSIGAVHATLSRLENKGMVRSWVGGANSNRGGRAKRFFEVTASGLEALKSSLAALLRMTEGIV